MLASFLVYLRPLEPARMDRHVGRWLNGLFYHLLHEGNPALSAELHHQLKIKPFTISTLRGEFRSVDGARCAVPEQLYHVRYTVLTAELFEALGQVLLERYLERRHVEIDHQPFEIERIGMPPHERDRWAATATYEQLLHAPRPSREFILQFASPTAFKRGDQSFLFPLPGAVFGSLLRTWEAFSDLPLPEGVAEFAEQQLVASRYDLETRVIQAGKYQLLGFVGQCSYRAMDNDPRYLQALNALADYALFAGVGMKSTQGMGQARRV